MIRNYFKIALRSLQKNKLQTIINLLGLTVGTVCCLSILIYVFAQLGYDDHHKDAEAIYRVRTIIEDPNAKLFNAASSGPPIGFAMKEDFPEVIEATRLVYMGEGTEDLLRTSDGTAGFYEPRGYLADPTIFNIFNFNLLEGNPDTALVAPNTVVLSSSLAKKLFGDVPVLNKTIISGSGEQQLSLTVTGVFDDSDLEKSHLNPNYLVTINTPGLGQFVRTVQNFATQNFIYTYVKLNNPENASLVQNKLPEFLENRGAKDFAAFNFKKELILQKVSDIHLHSKGISRQIGPVSDISYLYLLITLALFIQLVACVNFINLSTARANKRAKEIGVRKTIGADKKSLIGQFLGESILLSLLATVVSIPLTCILLPLVNQLTQGDISFLAILDWRVLSILLVIGILTGIIAGIYPALILSSIKPTRVLKGAVTAAVGGTFLRKGLVVFQFVISIGLIATVYIITEQVRYAQNKDMGFNKDNLIAVRLGTQEAFTQYNTLKTNMSKIPGIKSISGCNIYPSQFLRGDVGAYLPGNDPTKPLLVKVNGIQSDYLKTIDTELLTGRGLKSQDSSRVVVNKATIDAFNISIENAVGTNLSFSTGGDVQTVEVVGITEDFHFASLKEEVEPIMLFLDISSEWLLVKTNTSDFEMILNQMETVWKQVNKTTPFIYNFIDKETEKLIAEEKRLANISIVFTTLAILISCLGLFGLISFMAEQKKKEIGIRKVLGASVSTVMKMLTKDFFLLILIALAIATPLSYYFMENWLQDFTYRISISWWVFLIAGIVTMTITFLTVSIQAIKAATANPVNSLRTE
ncbi:ABC transporter permease [Aquimarina sp. MMG015]|uniref:ABC transporter permease n=1 Tax=unclassified Aquimarina TaxID=2627091 RepID=UPI000E5335A4|nr:MULTISPECIES: ABC transporter permease [unclassified Aquimarina]AXT54507.1 ABC transporter permease [Aquimarina sp. AD1]MBQ4804642.1 ABC transporter permease [Aquimarina sp. MMG015]RKN25056.1 FtsX-like permease family protein [Aquimarina sp. AD1]